MTRLLSGLSVGLHLLRAPVRIVLHSAKGGVVETMCSRLRF